MTTITTISREIIVTELYSNVVKMFQDSDTTEMELTELEHIWYKVPKSENHKLETKVCIIKKHVADISEHK